MEIVVVLAVGLDAHLLDGYRETWKSVGIYAVSTATIKGAIEHFRAGDFDLVMLGHSIPVEARERLTFLIRASGGTVPVVCISSSPGHHDSFADATFERDSSDLLNGIRDLLRSKALVRTAPATPNGT